MPKRFLFLCLLLATPSPLWAKPFIALYSTNLKYIQVIYRDNTQIKIANCTPPVADPRIECTRQAYLMRDFYYDDAENYIRVLANQFRVTPVLPIRHRLRFLQGQIDRLTNRINNEGLTESLKNKLRTEVAGIEAQKNALLQSPRGKAFTRLAGNIDVYEKAIHHLTEEDNNDRWDVEENETFSDYDAVSEVGDPSLQKTLKFGLSPGQIWEQHQSSFREPFNALEGLMALKASEFDVGGYAELEILQPEKTLDRNRWMGYFRYFGSSGKQELLLPLANFFLPSGRQTAMVEVADHDFLIVGGDREKRGMVCHVWVSAPDKGGARYWQQDYFYPNTKEFPVVPQLRTISKLKEGFLLTSLGKTEVILTELDKDGKSVRRINAAVKKPFGEKELEDTFAVVTSDGNVVVATGSKDPKMMENYPDQWKMIGLSSDWSKVRWTTATSADPNQRERISEMAAISNGRLAVIGYSTRSRIWNFPDDGESGLSKSWFRIVGTDGEDVDSFEIIHNSDIRFPGYAALDFNPDTHQIAVGTAANLRRYGFGSMKNFTVFSEFGVILYSTALAVDDLSSLDPMAFGHAPKRPEFLIGATAFKIIQVPKQTSFLFDTGARESINIPGTVDIRATYIGR